VAYGFAGATEFVKRGASGGVKSFDDEELQLCREIEKVWHCGILVRAERRGLVLGTGRSHMGFYVQ
jgi:hypothetical protein